jgi:hypothetical protein
VGAELGLGVTGCVGLLVVQLIPRIVLARMSMSNMKQNRFIVQPPLKPS